MKKILFIIILAIPFGAFAQENGEVKSHVKLTVNLSTASTYGTAIAEYRSSENDDIYDLIIGSANFQNNGEVFIHGLNTNGTIQSTVRITRNEGGFGDHNISQHRFGSAIANVGDINDDGFNDIVVGVPHSGGNPLGGSVWFLYLDADKKVIGGRRISDTTSGIGSELNTGALFGSSIANIGDIDGNGYDDIVIGATNKNGESSSSGCVYVVLLEKFGKIKSIKKINDENPIFNTTHTYFGASVSSIGDLDGDGNVDIAVGEIGNSTGKGSVWILFLNSDGSLKSSQLINENNGGFTGTLTNNFNFGYSLASLGDIDGDGNPDIAVGYPGENYDSIGALSGAVWILFLDTNGTVKKHLKIGNSLSGFTGSISAGDRFGASVARISDLDGDSVPELAVGAFNDQSPPNGNGAVYILFLKGVPQLSVELVALPAFEVQVYPNPAKDVLQFDFGQMPSSDASVKIFDMHGRLILSQEIHTHTNPSVDVSSIQTIGVYYLQIHCNGSVLHKKVLIER